MNLIVVAIHVHSTDLAIEFFDVLILTHHTMSRDADEFTDVVDEHDRRNDRIGDDPCENKKNDCLCVWWQRAVLVGEEFGGCGIHG